MSLATPRPPYYVDKTELFGNSLRDWFVVNLKIVLEEFVLCLSEKKPDDLYCPIQPYKKCENPASLWMYGQGERS